MQHQREANEPAKTQIYLVSHILCLLSHGLGGRGGLPISGQSLFGLLPHRTEMFTGPSSKDEHTFRPQGTEVDEWITVFVRVETQAGPPECVCQIEIHISQWPRTVQEKLVQSATDRTETRV